MAWLLLLYLSLLHATLTPAGVTSATPPVPRPFLTLSAPGRRKMRRRHARDALLYALAVAVERQSPGEVGENTPWWCIMPGRARGAMPVTPAASGAWFTCSPAGGFASPCVMPRRGVRAGGKSWSQVWEGRRALSRPGAVRGTPRPAKAAVGGTVGPGSLRQPGDERRRWTNWRREGAVSTTQSAARLCRDSGPVYRGEQRCGRCWWALGNPGTQEASPKVDQARLGERRHVREDRSRGPPDDDVSAATVGGARSR